MAYQYGYQGGYADVVGGYGDYEGGYGASGAPVQSPGVGGGWSKPFTWRWPPPYVPPPPAPPPPPPPPVRIAVTIRVAPPRMRVRVVSVALWPGSLRLAVESRAALTGPPWLVYATKAQRDAREARELAEVAVAMEALGW